MRAPPFPRLVPAPQLLFTLNEWLARTALIAAPLTLPAGQRELDTVDVALPLERGARVARGVDGAGRVVEVPLPMSGDVGMHEGAAALGLHTALGSMRLLHVHGGSPVTRMVPMERVEGDRGGDSGDRGEGCVYVCA